MVMRYWFDTEFIEAGRSIDLISIGVVSEDGRRYYAESMECRLERAGPWVSEHVLPHLTGVKTGRWEIAGALEVFMGREPEIWGYYADYDWVVLCQLFGTMMDLPKGWPMYCRDVKQLCDSRGNPPLPKQIPETEHHALYDAIWTKQAHAYLEDHGKMKSLINMEGLLDG